MRSASKEGIAIISPAQWLKGSTVAGTAPTDAEAPAGKEQEMVINAWVFDEEGEMHDRLIDSEDLMLFGAIKEDDDVLGRGRDDD